MFVSQRPKTPRNTIPSTYSQQQSTKSPPTTTPPTAKGSVSQPTTLRRRIAHIAALVFCADHALRPRALCLLQMAFFSLRSFRKPCPGSVPRRPRFEKLSDRECRRLYGWSYERIPNSQELACQPLPCSSLSSYQCLTLFRMERCPFRRRAASSHGVTATAGLSPLRSAARVSTGPGPGESTR